MVSFLPLSLLSVDWLCGVQIRLTQRGPAFSPLPGPLWCFVSLQIIALPWEALFSNMSLAKVALNPIWETECPTAPEMMISASARWSWNHSCSCALLCELKALGTFFLYTSLEKSGE